MASVVAMEDKTLNASNVPVATETAKSYEEAFVATKDEVPSVLLNPTVVASQDNFKSITSKQELSIQIISEWKPITIEQLFNNQMMTCLIHL